MNTWLPKKEPGGICGLDKGLRIVNRGVDTSSLHYERDGTTAVAN